MKYMGSKSRVAKQIVPIIQRYINGSTNKVYIEPFVGGANVIDKIQCNYRIGFDINEYLIRLFQYLQAEGKLPEAISREEYARVRAHKENFQKWYVGCVGFLASYNGKFFGGYAGAVHTKAGTVRNYYDEARRNVIQQAEALRDVGFECWDYLDRKESIGVENCVIYCDPPYKATTQYAGASGFDHNEFWEVMRKWSQKTQC